MRTADKQQQKEAKKADHSRVERKSSRRNSLFRFIFTLVGISLEIGLIVAGFNVLNGKYEEISISTRVLALLLVLYIYASPKTSAMKTPWIVLILLVPVFGIVMYLLIGLNGVTRRMKERFRNIDGQLFPLLHQKAETVYTLREEDRALQNLSGYLMNYSRFPVWQNTDVTYYSDAAKALEAQKEALRKAKKFIFMEYYAIEDRESWAGVEEILKEKAAEGLTVRVFYDDMGSIHFLTKSFRNRLESEGIRCRVFNPFIPGLNAFLNNRDHRKITVIDGRVGFTGGYNLANEYFNVTHPYGYWKDTGLRLEGDAVQNLTVMFLEMWNAIRPNDIDDNDFSAFLPAAKYEAREKEGFVQPYGDSPLDSETVGENVYLSMAGYAKDYLWYMTPYLIITNEMTRTLRLAAKSGVDVRIITPGIPDKKIIYRVTRSYYKPLVDGGVRIFEYSPGFSHAKMAVTDDKAAVCGTINLDYRSFYHHFEDSCLIMKKDAVFDIRDDFSKMFSECTEVTENYRSGRSRAMDLGQMILRMFAGLF